MNRLKLIEDVVTHLGKQGRRATEEGSRGLHHCFYKAPNGCKCGIGGLIPDELYDPQMESLVASQLLSGKWPALNKSFIERYGAIESRDGDFLNAVQTRLHDSCPDLSFPPNLAYAAKSLRAFLSEDWYESPKSH